MRLPKSYVLPSIGLVFLRCGSVPDGVAQSPREESLPTFLRHFADSDTSIYVHEWGHVLQSIYYPYLFLRGVRELALLDAIYAQARRAGVALEAGRMVLAQDAVESLLMDGVAFYFSRNATGGFEISPATGAQGGRHDITEIDLLEGANSVFEFRIIHGAEGDAVAYEAWLREGPRYTRTYKMLARAFGKDVAYRLLQPLVTAAFHTTYPVTAFTALLNAVARSPSDYNDFDPADAEVKFVNMLSRTAPPLEQTTRRLVQRATDDGYAFLTSETMAILLRDSEQSPLYPLAAKVWSPTARPGRQWLHRPYQYIRDRGHNIRDEIEWLTPPFSFLFFPPEPHLRGGGICLLSSLYRKTPVPSWWGHGERLWTEVIDVLQFRRVLVFNLARDLPSAGPQHCEHVGCSVHRTGLCNGNLYLPKEPAACRFRTYLRSFEGQPSRIQ